MSVPTDQTQETTQKPTTGYMTEDKTPDPVDAESKVDDYGYEKKPEPKAEEKPAEKPKEKVEEKPEPKEAASGYGKEPEKVAKAEDKPAEKDADDYGIIDTEGLLPEEINSIRDFAKQHKVSKEIVKALVAQKQAEIKKLSDYSANQEKLQETKVKEQRQGWYNELKDDPDFGGTNFSTNIKKAEQIIEEHLPNLKKKLTESGGMLPPYVMRDLAKLSDVLHSTENLVTGDPLKLVKDDDKDSKEENDPLAYYNS